jgi:hypothetical protein
MDLLAHYEIEDHTLAPLFALFFARLNEKQTKGNDITNAVDFLLAPTIDTVKHEIKIFNIEKYHTFPFDRILAKEKKYNKKIADLLLNTTDFTCAPEAGETLVYTLSQGYTLVELTEQNNLKKESALMQHCIGSSQSYYNNILKKKIKIYSLRDRKNKPHITLELNLERNVITQVQGKNNQMPILKYCEYLQELYTKGVNYSEHAKHRLECKILANTLCFGREAYAKALKARYDNNDWSGCENTTLDCSNMPWFKIAPNITVDEFIATNSGLQHYEPKFRARVVIQNKCQYATVAPNITLDTFIANKSALTTYPPNFKAKNVIQSDCPNALAAPNCKLEFFNATNSGLTHYPPKFSANKVIQDDCPNAKTAPNCTLVEFSAANSGLQTYPSNFIATDVIQSDCKNATIAPNCPLDFFQAKRSGLRHYPKQFRANTVVQKYCPDATTAPNCTVINFYAQDSGLQQYPKEFTSSFVNDKNCDSLNKRYFKLLRNKRDGLHRFILTTKLYKWIPKLLD